jgi:hypothetical protein
VGSFAVAATINTMPTANFNVVVNSVKQSLPYNVVVVTLPTGNTYEPESKVKNSDQAAIAGWPIGTPIRIAVSPGGTGLTGSFFGRVAPEKVHFTEC